MIAGSLGFLGVIGEHRAQTTIAARQASTAEDPANRRNLGGGKMRITFYLYPKTRPAVVTGDAGPQVYHGDNFSSPVTEANPAHPGEVLVLRATGLGPVKPDLAPPGAVPFSVAPFQRVNSPVDVIVNGTDVPAINSIGWPGETSIYRVDFQVPANAVPGQATLQVSAAWIPGPAVTIPIQ